MTKKHLLDLVLGVLSIDAESTNDSCDHLAIAETKPHYVVVDDSLTMLMTWARQSETHDIKTFRSPEDFFAAVESDADLMAKASGIVTDQNFDDFSEIKGLEFARELRTKGYEGPVYLSSNGDFTEKDLVESNVKLIPKRPQLAIATLEL